MPNPQHENDGGMLITRLARTLSRAGNQFTLLFVVVNLPETRKQLAQQLVQVLERPVVELTVPKEQLTETTLDYWVQSQLENAPKDAVVFLHDLPESVPTEKKALRRVMQQLNWRRSALARIHRPLVIWLPQYLVSQLAEDAPDLYDWYSNVYEFSLSTEAVEKQKDGWKEELTSSQTDPAERMSRAEKERWLHTLTELLDENKEPNQYRAHLLNELGRLHNAIGNLEDALECYEQSLAIQQEIGDKSGEGTTLNNISQIYDARGDYETALRYLEQSLAIRQEIGDKSGEGRTLNNISQIFKARGDYETALRYLEQSLAIRQEIGDKSGEGRTLNNISQIFKARGDYETALRYLEQSLAIQQEIGDKSGEGTTLNNISQIYDARGDYETALRYLEQSLAIQQEIGDKSGEGTTLNNISQIYDARGDYETALRYLEQSLAIQQEIGDKSGMCATLFNMGHISAQNEKMKEAVGYWLSCYQIAREIGEAQALQELESLAKQLGGGGLEFWELLAK